MKTIFAWMLKRYSNTESGRIEIMKIMHTKVCEDYNEQTSYGNFYNHFIEFIMANPFVVECALTGDKKSLVMMKNGVGSTFDDSVVFIKKEM